MWQDRNEVFCRSLGNICKMTKQTLLGPSFTGEFNELSLRGSFFIKYRNDKDQELPLALTVFVGLCVFIDRALLSSHFFFSSTIL